MFCKNIRLLLSLLFLAEKDYEYIRKLNLFYLRLILVLGLLLNFLGMEKVFLLILYHLYFWISLFNFTSHNLFIMNNYKLNFLLFKNISDIYIIKVQLYGDWGLGIGDWGLGIGPHPQSPIPNPQSPIPNYF